MKRISRTILGVVFVLMVSHETVQADTIHRELQKRVPDVVRFLNERKLKTVGVLKFRVKKHGERISDSVGPFNSLLADRLEIGLILGNPVTGDEQLNIIKDASAQTSKIQGADHLTPEGRAKLFGPKFGLAWGEQDRAADAFVTGVVQIADDMQSATIGILCFTPDSQQLELVCDAFTADLTAESLTELGESYNRRSAFNAGTFGLNDVANVSRLTFKQIQKRKQEMVRKEVKRVRTQQTKFPTQEPEIPVRIAILYDGKPVSPEFRDGRAFIPEPTEGQDIQIVMQRGDVGDTTLGVVLKVNGENTLYRQRGRDFDCSKWLLTPKHKLTRVRGYQMADGKTMEKFRVMSAAESAQKAMNYGRYVGQIQLTVFQELKGPKPKPSLPEPGEADLAAMLRGTQPEKKPKNHGALVHQLRTSKGGSTRRGIIGQGQQQKNEIRKVKFVADPTPVMSITLTYYTP